MLVSLTIPRRVVSHHVQGKVVSTHLDTSIVGKIDDETDELLIMGESVRIACINIFF